MTGYVRITNMRYSSEIKPDEGEYVVVIDRTSKTFGNHEYVMKNRSAEERQRKSCLANSWTVLVSATVIGPLAELYFGPP